MKISNLKSESPSQVHIGHQQSK